MSQPTPLPVLSTTGQAWRLLWRHRLLHLKAIWPPAVFLVAAEVLYHRIVGNADTLPSRWQAVQAHPWWMPVLALFCWLAGLKFLLSFSISWRRHLLLRERFDPFFFKAPFWRYLALLGATYVCLILYVFAMLAIMSAIAGLFLGESHALFRLVVLLGLLFAAPQSSSILVGVAILVPLAFAIPVLWAIIRQVPFFTALTLDLPRPGWRAAVASMRGQVWRYVAAFVLTMLPVVLANMALDALLKLAGADRHSVPVALGESAFRQAMLFLHVSLGASIGALVLINRFGAPPAQIATDGASSGRFRTSG